MQVAIIGTLVIIGWQVSGLRDEADTSEQTATAVNAILARSCGAASFEELRRQGLIEECRLAQDGGLVDAIPEDVLPEAGADPTDVNPDLVEDDDTSTPADVSPLPIPPATNDQVEAIVDDYLTANPLSAQPGYQRSVQRATAAYLTANPPEPGRPPTEGEVRSAVRTVILANPPADGEPGEPGDDGEPGSPGRSVASAVLDGCDVAFTYSDGTTDRVGPVCGADGSNGADAPPPTDAQVAQAVVAYCSANGACTGPPGPPGVVQTADNCTPAEGEFVTDVAISGPVGDPATITISCTTGSILPGLGGARG